MPTPPLSATVPTTLRDRRQPERGRKAIFTGAEAAAVGSHVSARGRQRRAEPGSPAAAGGLGACGAGGGRGEPVSGAAAALVGGTRTAAVSGARGWADASRVAERGLGLRALCA